MKKLILLLVILLVALSLHKVYATPVAMQKMVCYPIDVSIVNNYDPDEIIEKSQIVFTNEKHKSDIPSIYKCELNTGEVCFMKLEGKTPIMMSCFRG